MRTITFWIDQNQETFFARKEGQTSNWQKASSKECFFI